MIVVQEVQFSEVSPTTLFLMAEGEEGANNENHVTVNNTQNATFSPIARQNCRRSRLRSRRRVFVVSSSDSSASPVNRRSGQRHPSEQGQRGSTSSENSVQAGLMELEALEFTYGARRRRLSSNGRFSANPAPSKSIGNTSEATIVVHMGEPSAEASVIVRLTDEDDKGDGTQTFTASSSMWNDFDNGPPPSESGADDFDLVDEAAPSPILDSTLKEGLDEFTEEGLRQIECPVCLTTDFAPDPSTSELSNAVPTLGMNPDGQAQPCKPNTCGHIHCFSCLKTWSGKTNLCPVCRQPYSYIVILDSEGRARGIENVTERQLRADEMYDVTSESEVSSSSSSSNISSSSSSVIESDDASDDSSSESDNDEDSVVSFDIANDSSDS